MQANPFQGTAFPRFGHRVPDCKGSRFITTNRYAPNEAWAGKVEDLAQSLGQELSCGDIPNGGALIARIVSGYARTVQEEHQFTAWGKNRDYIEFVPVNYFNDSSKTRGTALLRQAGESLGKADIPVARFEQRNKRGVTQTLLKKLSWREEACGPEAKTVRFEMPVHGKKLQLMQLQPMFVDGKPEIGWVFPEFNPEVVQAVAQLTDEALSLKDAPKTPETLEKAVAKVAQLHWLFTVGMPYVRGTAGTADILSKVIFDQLGIETGNWREGLSPDMEAFLTPQPEAFIRRYASFFTSPPKFAVGKRLAEVA